MRIKFNTYERVAGMFVLTAIFGSLTVMVGVAIKKGWFEPKVSFETALKNAEGIREGTQVQIAGLRAGAITHIELKSDNEVHVRMEIAEKFHDRIREDSVVRAIRPFIIGEKVMEITVGGEGEARVAQNGFIKSEPTMDVMDLVSGKTIGPHLEKLSRMFDNLRVVAEALLDPERSKAMIRMFDDLSPLVKNMNDMSKEAAGLLKGVNKDKMLVRMVTNLSALTDQINMHLPVIAKESPALAKDMAKIAKNVAVLTEELSKTLPALQEIGPELPRASRRAIEALDETVVTLKALQKSFLLKGSVRDVKDEEAQRDSERVPANKK
jgi:phospholipid/cholesterol/gamma-HCH transport system substrate-binding protein